MDRNSDPGPWGPTVDGGRRWRLAKRLLTGIGVVGLVAVVAAATTGALLYQRAERNLTRVPVDGLEPTEIADSDARSFLLVGSDSREGTEDLDVPLGSAETFGGQRSDVMIHVSVSADRDDVSLLSLPRDLMVEDPETGAIRKLGDTYVEGPEELVTQLRANFGLPVNHFAQISFGGFLEVVDTLGEVEICLDEPLVDEDSGADFDAGCHQMDAQEALSYVRSRQSNRGDFERTERQQRFLRSVVDETIEADVLTNVPRLFELVEDVASNVTTDQGFGVNQMRGLAQELAPVVADGIPMSTVPGYIQTLTADGVSRSYVLAYRPGAEAMFARIREGEPLADQGRPEERAETEVGVVSGGRAEGQNIILRTLRYAGFDQAGAGVGEEATDAGAETVVYRLPGHDDEAGWVAATLGAQILELPVGVAAPADAEVLVATGDDAGY